MIVRPPGSSSYSPRLKYLDLKPSTLSTGIGLATLHWTQSYKITGYLKRRPQFKTSVGSLNVVSLRIKVWRGPLFDHIFSPSPLRFQSINELYVQLIVISAEGISLMWRMCNVLKRVGFALLIMRNLVAPRVVLTMIQIP